LLLLWAVALIPGVVCENPLGKVIQLLDSLTAKITKEGEEEAKAYAAFVEWCDDAAANTGFEIKTATAQKGKLEAAIGEEAGEISAAGTKIEELAGSIATDEADLKSATSVREKESADFTASETELMDVIDTLGRAITVIEREMAKKPCRICTNRHQDHFRVGEDLEHHRRCGIVFHPRQEQTCGFGSVPAGC
jgi:hypothetical protein